MRRRVVGGVALLLCFSEAFAAPPPTVRPSPVYLDAPEISRSVGEPGEIVVFWPRVIPRSESPQLHAIAAQVQQQMIATLKQAHPGVKLDVRPAPERVCQRAGCGTSTMGTLLLHQGDACVAIALLSGPGQSPALLAPWVGSVNLKTTSVPFREPPENQVQITDFERCSELPQEMVREVARVQNALQGLAVPPKQLAPVPPAVPTRAVVPPQPSVPDGRGQPPRP